MSKPSDFTPERVLEVKEPPPRSQKNVDREVWISRGIGMLLLIGGWAAITVHHGWGSAEFLVDTFVLSLLGAFAFLAAARTRRIAVNTEKRLRLGLLVHNMELENMAMQDDLTQLFNRRYFFDRLERELQTARAFKRPLSVVLVDLDSMKFVNDTHGHRVGDELLQAFGRFLLEHTRTSDVPARIGGDEFAVILPDTSQRAAAILTTRLAKRLENTVLIDRGDVTIRVSASFGISGYPTDGDTEDAIMQQADAQMYAEKSQHKAGASAGATPGANGSEPRRKLRLEQAES
jgi:diguanylate cyclase (GGDEF)-like protein